MTMIMRRAFTTCFFSNTLLRFPIHATTNTITTIPLLRLHSLSQSPTCPNPNHIPNHLSEFEQLLLEKSRVGFDKLDDALLVFDKMLRMKPLPTVIHFTQLLAALVRMKHYSVAVSVFSDMCSFSIPVNVVTYNIAINCCSCLLYTSPSPRDRG